MAHSDYTISYIQLPGSSAVYQICDKEAIHSVEELGLSSALVFKGTVTGTSSLPSPSATTIGHVYLNSETNEEYVGVNSGTEDAPIYTWETLGSIHDAAASDHTHTVTVTGTNAESTVTGTVTVPKITVSPVYVKPSISDTAVAADGTATVMTSFGTPTTTSVLTEMNTTTIKNPDVSTVTIPNVTDAASVTASKVTTTAGSEALWSASVTDGILSFSWSTNKPTSVTVSDVTASKVTLGTSLTASKVTTTDTTVATTAKNTATVVTSFGTPTTASVLTGVKVETQPTITLTTQSTPTDGAIITGYNIEASSTSASIQNGKAAAQKWTAGTVTVSEPK